MTDKPDSQGPGEEQAGFNYFEAEPRPVVIPEGEMPDIEPVPASVRKTVEVPPVTIGDGPEAGANLAIRRTSTDRDALEAVHINGGDAEPRQDVSAADDQREETFDPAQDNSGPQSDQA